MAPRSGIFAALRPVDKLPAMVGLLGGACLGGGLAYALGHTGATLAGAGVAGVLAAAVASAARDARRALLALGGGLLIAALFVVIRARQGTEVSEVVKVVPGRVKVFPMSAKPRCPAGMVLIPGGRFEMGTKAGEGGEPNEQPEHAVEVGSFCLDVTEVTVDAYGKCVKEGKCSAEHLKEVSFDGKSFSAEARCNHEVVGKGNHPMNCVDWQQSEAYCGGQGSRLPTEEEWEYAARGGARQRKYPWGAAQPSNQLCWKETGTCEVGRYKSGDSVWGVHDLAGNVWEWTGSRVCPYPSSGVSDNCANENRVLRGGSWYVGVPTGVRAANRGDGPPAGRGGSGGFRCASTL